MRLSDKQLKVWGLFRIILKSLNNRTEKLAQTEVEHLEKQGDFYNDP